MGGREIGSALFNGGGTLGLDFVPSGARSVLILGGRRVPDTAGRSHNFCPFSTSRAAAVVCGASGRSEGRGGGDSAGCVVDEAGYMGIVGVCVGTGCVGSGGGFDGSGRIGDEGLSGTKASALGFNGALKGKGVTSGRGGWGRGSSRTVFGGRRVNRVSDFVTGGVGCTNDASGGNEGGVCENANPFEWWG